jgi:hypothetical protein
MAGSKTNYFEDKVLNVLRNQAIAAIAQPYVGLFTVLTDGEASSVTEVTGNNYGRAAVTFGAPSGGQMSNSGTVSFATPSGTWGTIVGWGVFDADTVGNMTHYCDQTPNKTINQDDVVEFAASALVIQES